MTLIRVLFTRGELVALKRCLICGWHPRTQGHHADCPVPNRLTRKEIRHDGR